MSLRFECRTCWHVYDPDEFDAAWEVPSRARFEELPDNWCCPVCEAPKDKFIRLGEVDA